MVLDIAEIETDLAARSNVVGLVAAFGKTLDDVGFAAEEAEEGIVLLAGGADMAEGGIEVVGAGDKDFFFNDVGFVFDGLDGWGEAIDNVVTGERLVQKEHRGRREHTSWRSRSSLRSRTCSLSASRCACERWMREVLACR